ncbi:tRNA (adenosine(37)-N6)-dimethylallyltransferase MiaA [Roseivivax sediminis]|uniref:tRNA dimethylallyltransferase n=1 Tax=Roseivivax sediminis TaxID=936889 RepID=A0A1I1XRN6_9RHOB|nr:tRNA (adenosine(37)-N6)-dimethylallyltransferase MiaA [Roseivivax sediminis]SFE08210.1 tRNA dimethylallyltransferase [Roseivivax sediminis]
MRALADIPPDRPVLIAGPTASGKSGLALEIAARQGGVIVNADAIQVFSDWRVLTARPTPQEEAAAPHVLYGHVPGDAPYSVGRWLRDLAPILEGPERPIVVGGTGLYFAALTEGLADIPETDAATRALSEARMAREGRGALLDELDAETRARIDPLNPVRVQRAWEVQHMTGRGIAAWQDDTPPPLLPLDRTHAIVVDAPKDWLDPRIAARFETMLAAGALDEARENAPSFTPDRPSAKAIGARELIAHVAGTLDLDTARARAVTQTRQFAKRQRTWFRARMGAWTPWTPAEEAA